MHQSRVNQQRNSYQTSESTSIAHGDNKRHGTSGDDSKEDIAWNQVVKLTDTASAGDEALMSIQMSQI